jgi:dienelactone hydrolase
VRSAACFSLLVIAACGSSAPPPPLLVADAGLLDAAASPVVVDAPVDASRVEVALADAPPAADAVASRPDAAGSSPWPAVSDFGARGPLAVTRDADTGPGKAYDVFRPTQLADGRRHPILSWANGTNYGLDLYAPLLEHWASHGFVIIAGHTNTTAGGGTHKAGIDWLVAEDARAGGPYAGALDVKMIGAAGHSQGGGATIAAGSDAPGVTGIVATAPLMALLRFEKDESVVARQKAPMLDVIATNDTNDRGAEAAGKIFAGATGELVQAAFVGVHTDAMSPGMFAPTLAWFRLHLMGDEAARAFFYPAGTCGLCRDQAWQSVRYKP